LIFTTAEPDNLNSLYLVILFDSMPFTPILEPLVNQLCSLNVAVCGFFEQCQVDQVNKPRILFPTEFKRFHLNCMNLIGVENFMYLIFLC
jgi:hypothetical protein